MINIVLVDDQSNRARELQTCLQQADMQCRLYQSNQDLAQKLESQESDILLLRLSLSQADGFSVCRNIRSIYKGFIVLLAEVQDDIDEIVSLEMEPMNTSPNLLTPGCLSRACTTCYAGKNICKRHKSPRT